MWAKGVGSPQLLRAGDCALLQIGDVVDLVATAFTDAPHSRLTYMLAADPRPPPPLPSLPALEPRAPERRTTERRAVSAAPLPVEGAALLVLAAQAMKAELAGLKGGTAAHASAGSLKRIQMSRCGAAAAAPASADTCAAPQGAQMPVRADAACTVFHVPGAKRICMSLDARQAAEQGAPPPPMRVSAGRSAFAPLASQAGPGTRLLVQGCSPPSETSSQALPDAAANITTIPAAATAGPPAAQAPQDASPRTAAAKVLAEAAAAIKASLAARKMLGALPVIQAVPAPAPPAAVAKGVMITARAPPPVQAVPVSRCGDSSAAALLGLMDLEQPGEEAEARTLEPASARTSAQGQAQQARPVEMDVDAHGPALQLASVRTGSVEADVIMEQQTASVGGTSVGMGALVQQAASDGVADHRRAQRTASVELSGVKTIEQGQVQWAASNGTEQVRPADQGQTQQAAYRVDAHGHARRAASAETALAGADDEGQMQQAASVVGAEPGQAQRAVHRVDAQGLVSRMSHGGAALAATANQGGAPWAALAACVEMDQLRAGEQGRLQRAASGVGSQGQAQRAMSAGGDSSGAVSGRSGSAAVQALNRLRWTDALHGCFLEARHKFAGFAHYCVPAPGYLLHRLHILQQLPQRNLGQ